MKTSNLLRAAMTVLGVLLAGCAHVPTSPTGDARTLFRDALFARPSEPVDTTAIFAFDTPMRHFLDRQIVPRARHEDPRRVLLGALRGKLRLDYDAAMTRTAAQAFAAREGNCLSLVIMTAAFARQLGIEVTFQSVYGFDTWSRNAGFTVLSEHVNLVLGPRRRQVGRYTITAPGSGAEVPMIVDFQPPGKMAHAVVKPVPERTIVAMYLNNRAAEVMVGGDVDRAYWFVRAALEADPTFANAANTLAVVYMQRDHLASAELALRYTLSREPGNAPALSNLVRVLDAEGRTAEARTAAARLAEIQRHPPFYFYDRGMTALKEGDYAAARRLFEKELSQRPYDDQSHFQLAVTEFLLGDMQRARKQMELAMENSTTHKQHALYAAKLRHLKAF